MSKTKHTSGWPTIWIKRDFEDLIQDSLKLDKKIHPLKIFPIWLFLGPRQVGKSSLLKHGLVLNLLPDDSGLGISPEWDVKSLMDLKGIKKHFQL